MNKPFALLLTTVAALGISSSAHATYSHLCTSVPSACTYSGPDASVLRQNVCWNGTVATLKGSSSCPSGAWPYYVDYGAVDSAGVVTAYIPLDWACDHPNICVTGTPPEGAGPEPICCDNGTCYPLTNTGCTADKLLCKNGVTNEDGSVTCFEGTEV